MPHRENKILNYYIKYSIGVIAIVLLLIIPESIFQNQDYNLCIHSKIFGIQCPLCGMTRAAHELIQFHFVKAVYYNFAILLLSGFILLDIAFDFTRAKIIFYLRRITALLLFISLIIIYILRLYR